MTRQHSAINIYQFRVQLKMHLLLRNKQNSMQTVPAQDSMATHSYRHLKHSNRSQNALLKTNLKRNVKISLSTKTKKLAHIS